MGAALVGLGAEAEMASRSGGSMRKAFITGVAGTALSDNERRLIADARPAGLILFARNLETADQIKALVADFKAAAGTEHTLVLIDQEGGRVQRLRPPLAASLPSASAYAAHHAGDREAAAASARQVARLLADELAALGIDTNCAPVLDLPVPGAHAIIGNRAFGLDVDTVVAVGRAFAEGLMDGGILPVMKHIPGHGRAFADSHLELPVVDATRAELERTDFAPFKALADLPAAMTAHVVFTAIDPVAPASTSGPVVGEIIRGTLGFDGLLMSDDLGMQALTGSFADRTRAVVAAGADLALHCSGDVGEMQEVARAAPPLKGRALERFEAALAITRRPRAPHDAAAAQAVLARLVAQGT
jgi:beta-N-acetylhexosaminidase